MSLGNSSGWLRIYFDAQDSSYTTVPCSYSTSAASLCAQLARKKGLSGSSLQSHALFVCTAEVPGQRSERRMEPHEMPLELQEKCRKQGTGDAFRLSFRTIGADEPSEASLNEQAAAVSADALDEFDPPSTNAPSFSVSSRSFVPPSPSHFANCPSLDSSVIRAGYLEKRGKRNTAWKERWFVVKPNGLHYYKTHAHVSPIATIPLHEAFVRTNHDSCQGRCALPFLAAPSIANLATSPPLPTPHAHSSLSKCSYEFEIDTVVRLFYLRARSYPDMMGWLRDLAALRPPCAENLAIDEAQTQIDTNELHVANDDEGRIQSLLQLDSLLHDPIGVEQLMQFETERARERHLLAWLEAQGFARIVQNGVKTKEVVLERAKTIYSSFLEPGCTQELTEVPLSVRNSVQQALQREEVNATLFNDVQASLLEHLRHHSFPAFLKSAHFDRALGKLLILADQQSPSPIEPSALSRPRPSISTPSTNRFSFSQAPAGGALHDDTEHSNLSASMARAAALPRGAEMHSKAMPGNTEGEEPGSIDDNHSISAQPLPATASMFSSLYGVGAAAVGAVGAFVDPLLSPSAAADAAAASSALAPPMVPISGKNMSPGSLAVYLESIGQADAKHRSASNAGGATAPGARDQRDPNAKRGSQSSMADSDSDESEAEEAEEEGIFDAAPKSIFEEGADRSASFSIPAHIGSKTRDRVSLFDTPAIAETDDGLTASAAANGTNRTAEQSSSATTLSSPPSAQASADSPLRPIHEADASSPDGPNAGGSPARHTEPNGASDGTSSLRVETMHAALPVEGRRRSTAVHASHPTAAAIRATASKWKQSKSIFDDMDEDDDEGEVFTPAKPTHAASASPAARPAPSPPSDPAPSLPSDGLSSAHIDLALLQEEEVDVADLNLDEGDMF